MKISDIINQKNITISCEIFPPKTDAALENIDALLAQTAALKPDFISVTYGAGGSTSKRTAQLTARLQSEYKATALAHLTCVGASYDDIDAAAREYIQNGIYNILALRGDKPAGAAEMPEGDCKYACQLIEHLRAIDGGDKLCIGAACYPEGHIECANRASDIHFLKEKVSAGVDFLTTQMFFDNDVLYRFLYRVLANGINVPVVAGIMPVINAKQIHRACQLSGTELPSRLRGIADRFADSPAAMRQAGIAYATEQIIDLIAHGVNNIHIYTMNKPDIAAKIMENLSDITA